MALCFGFSALITIFYDGSRFLRASNKQNFANSIQWGN
jgi:hypothetical protein